jgi:uncharacterized protein YdeI (YjbR/CyaY-like superfamily)
VAQVESQTLTRGLAPHCQEGNERTISYAEALDAALAWGWIDSQQRALDANSWIQRFSSRQADSPWSKINRSKAEALIAAGASSKGGGRATTKKRRQAAPTK